MQNSILQVNSVEPSGHLPVEPSAQMFCGESSTPFPRSDSFVSYIVFFKQKMQDRFPSLVEHLPLREQDEPPWLVLDRTFSAITSKLCHFHFGKCPTM